MASIEVVLISCPIFDCDSFINKVAASTSHIVTSGVDGSGLSLKYHPKFLAILGQFREGKTTKPKEAMLVNGVSDHMYFSFLISGFPLLELAEFDLALLVTEKLILATGTLKQWQDVMAAGHMESLNYHLRVHFSRLGLNQTNKSLT